MPFGIDIPDPDTVDPNDAWKPAEGSVSGIRNATTSAGRWLYQPQMPGFTEPAPVEGEGPRKKDKSLLEKFWDSRHTQPNTDPRASTAGPTGPGSDSTSPKPKVADPYAPPYISPDMEEHPRSDDYPFKLLHPGDAATMGPTGTGKSMLGSGVPRDPYKGPTKLEQAADAGPTGGIGNIPAYAQNTSGETPPTPGVESESLLGKLMRGLGENRGTLAGFAQGLLNHGLRTNSFSGLPQAAVADRAYGQANATADMLQRRGLPPDLAMTMAHDPQAMTAYLGQASGTSKRYQPIQVQDSLGNHHIVVFDPETGGLVNQTGVAGSGVSGVGSGELSSMPIQIDPKTGRDEAFAAAFEKSDPISYSAVDALLRGNINAAGRNTQKLLPYAARIEPGFDMTMYKKRQDAQKYWEGGGEGDKTTKSLSQATRHFADWAQSVDEQAHLPGGALVNKPANEIGTLIGTNTTYQPFKTNTHGLADELAGVWKGKLTDHEIKAWEENFPYNGTLAQQKAYTNKLLDMIEGGQGSLEEQRVKDFGATEAARRPGVTSPATQAKLNQIRAWANDPNAKMPKEPHKAEAMNAPVDKVLQEARQAIKEGAPRDMVIDRLRKNGIDPGTL